MALSPSTMNCKLIKLMKWRRDSPRSLSPQEASPFTSSATYYLQALNVCDPRYVRFFANEFARKTLLSPSQPGLAVSQRSMPAFGDQARALFLGPLEDRINVPGRHHCITMHPGIGWQRHSPVLNLIGYLRKASLAADQ